MRHGITRCLTVVRLLAWKSELDAGIVRFNASTYCNLAVDMQNPSCVRWRMDTCARTGEGVLKAQKKNQNHRWGAEIGHLWYLIHAMHACVLLKYACRCLGLCWASKIPAALEKERISIFTRFQHTIISGTWPRSVRPFTWKLVSKWCPLTLASLFLLQTIFLEGMRDICRRARDVFIYTHTSHRTLSFIPRT